MILNDLFYNPILSNIIMTNLSNKVFVEVLSFLNNTDKAIFISGKAGTGKTTFLRSLPTETFKKMIITAPTGVAAINAGGVTLHSFFQLPLVPFLPKNIKIFEKIKYDQSKQKVLREIELLIVDEISMVRADILDAIDFVLRKTRGMPELPFGGIQVVMIGDLYQLSPIVKANEWDELNTIYESPFFIDSKVYRQAYPVCFELTHVYRQNDADFLDLLNKIRVNSCTESDLEFVNSFYKKSENFSEAYINLTTHNAKAEKINRENLELLPGEPYCYTAEVIGDFDKNLFPADEKLYLKAGAQVVLLKNSTQDKKYFNGRIGKILKVGEDKIDIDFGNDDILSLSRETWSNSDYAYDNSTKKMVEVSLGSFRQFPIGLAWAITIHKSQGLSFEHAILDMEDAFVPGQVYVALSRLTSLKGLVLRSKITKNSLGLNPRIAKFSSDITPEVDLDKVLHDNSILFLERTLIGFFDLSEIIAITKSCSAFNHEIFDFLCDKLERLETISEKFIQQIIVIRKGGEDISNIYPRIISGSEYFIKELDAVVFSLRDYLKKVKNDPVQKRYFAFTRSTIVLLENRSKNFIAAKSVTESLKSGATMEEAIKLVRTVKVAKSVRGPSSKIVFDDTNQKTEEITLGLFRAGKSIDTIAIERNLTKVTIENHLSLYISAGEVSIDDLLSRESLDVILGLLRENPAITLSGIKLKVSGDISFGQIGAALEFWKICK